MESKGPRADSSSFSVKADRLEIQEELIMVQSKSKNQTRPRSEYSSRSPLLLLGSGRAVWQRWCWCGLKFFVLFMPSTDWMRPTPLAKTIYSLQSMIQMFISTSNTLNQIPLYSMAVKLKHKLNHPTMESNSQSVKSLLLKSLK